MADVSISELARGVPVGSALIPYSTGSSTLGTSVSAILQNAGNVGLGTNNPHAKLSIEGYGSLNGIQLGTRGDVDQAINSNIHITNAEPRGALSIAVGKTNVGYGDILLNKDATSTHGFVGIGTYTPAAKLDVNGRVFTRGYNHIEYAMVGPTQASINSIIAAESGYLNFDTTTNTENTMHISNSAVFELISTGNYGMKILKTGNLRIDYVQDIVTAAKAAYVPITQNYIGCRVSVNGVIRARTLMRHTDGIWSQITGACTLKVNANDAITFYLYSAAPSYIKISHLDAIQWSYFNFMFWC